MPRVLCRMHFVSFWLRFMMLVLRFGMLRFVMFVLGLWVHRFFA